MAYAHPDMAQVEALVNLAVLRWARESSGLSIEEAATRLKIKMDRLIAWEEGTKHLSVPQLRKLAELYKRPIAVFYLSKPPRKFQALKDFRKVDSDQEKHSPEFLFEVRRTEFRRDAALELHNALGTEPESFTVQASLGDDPETVGAILRSALSVPPPGHLVWRDQNQSLKAWRTALEQLGVLVFQARRIDSSEFRALSIATRPLPAILLNIKDSPKGRAFSLLHEATHLLLRNGGVCDLREVPKPHSVEERTEVFCNAVAAATMMPKDSFLAFESIAGLKALRDDWTDAEIVAISRKFGASREATVRRLLTLGKTTPAFYTRKRRQYEKEWAERPKPKELVIPQATLALATVGAMFARLVLEGYSRESITGSDVSEYFGVKIEHLPKIQATLNNQSQEAGA